jgi:RNA polymerase sigma-70 factor (ECF subfamily)
MSEPADALPAAAARPRRLTSGARSRPEAAPPCPPAGAASREGDDAAVVARVVAGELWLFEVLMRRHNQRLFRVLRAVLREDDEAADVMQEAYLRAYRELPRFRGEASFVTWLTRIALHEAFARLRRSRRLRPLGAPGEDAPSLPAPRDPAPDPEHATGNRELREALRRELERLPEGLRAVFVLREVEELSTREAAQALTISEENVKVRLHRAKALLRQRLDEQLGREARQLYLFAGPACDAVVAAVLTRLATEADVIDAAPPRTGA